jgi:hypothetical protein
MNREAGRARPPLPCPLPVQPCLYEARAACVSAEFRATQKRGYTRDRYRLREHYINPASSGPRRIPTPLWGTRHGRRSGNPPARLRSLHSIPVLAFPEGFDYDSEAR